jgi:uncharacterized protein (TIGR02145 family)
MKELKQLNMKAYIRNLVVFILGSILLWNCTKDEPITYPVVVPECEILFESGQTEYSYGDTIHLNLRATENSKYAIRMELYLDNDLLTVSSEKDFMYALSTDKSVEGEHSLMLKAFDYKDSSGMDIKKFHISPTNPVIFTENAVNIEDVSATIVGEVISTGGYSATWGICYNVNGNPTKIDNSYQSTDTIFAVKIEGLTKKTTYFAKTWVSYNSKTIYGEEVEFRTSDDIGSFIDERDNHSYKWVKIRDQIWMAENMAWEGDTTIVEVNSNDAWSRARTGYCYYSCNKEQYEKYGIFYQFKAALDVWPDGWHLPTPTEWEILAQSIGGLEVAGKHLKTRTGWKEEGNGTNYTGFSGLPAGFRYNDGWWGWDEPSMSKYAIWWADETKEEFYATQVSLRYNSDELQIYDKIVISQGRNVRCIKDE